MFDCKGCEDKLKCVTKQIPSCPRGFKIDRCCREYLAKNHKSIFRTLLKAPENMVMMGYLNITLICDMCRKPINIKIGVNPPEINNIGLAMGSGLDLVGIGTGVYNDDSTALPIYTNAGNSTVQTLHFEAASGTTGTMYIQGSSK